MTQHRKEVEVRGPWSLTTSRAFWEGFAPAALPKVTGSPEAELRTVFRVEADWSRAEARVLQRDGAAIVAVCGPGDLEAAAGQVARFLSLDIDATDWPEVGRRDPVIAAAQARLPGLRPCGFHSPYEAAAWAVLSQRLRVPQAAQLRADLTRRFGDDGAFPAPPTCAPSTSICRDAKPSICTPSPRQPSTACWTGRRCTAPTRSSRSARSGRSRDSGRSLRIWWCSAVPGFRTGCRTTNRSSQPRCRSSTARGPCCRRCRRPGARSGPGQRSISGPNMAIAGMAPAGRHHDEQARTVLSSRTSRCEPDDPPTIRAWSTRREGQTTSISPRMNCSTFWRATSSEYCSGGDFMK